MRTVEESSSRVWAPQVAAARVFFGFSSDEISRVTKCLGTRVISFDRGDELVTVGERARCVGLLLRGSVYARTVDPDGSRHLVAVVGKGDVYSEDVLWEAQERTHRTITAASAGEALLISMDRILEPGGPLCQLRSSVVENLFRIMSAKNRELQARLEIVSQKSLRTRLSLFLNDQRDVHGSSRQFTVPFSRAELAEYLNADRSALSRELARMKSDNLIDYHRNSFKILAGADQAMH